MRLDIKKSLRFTIFAWPAVLIINYLGARLTNQKFITIIQMRDDGDLKYSESEGGGVNLSHERTSGTKQTKLLGQGIKHC